MTDVAERTVAEPAVEPPAVVRPAAPLVSRHAAAAAPALGPGGPSLSQLQATAGNGAVTRLLQPKATPTVEPAPESESAVAVLAPSPVVVQAKLTVSSPGDPSERAADATASRVVSGQPRVVAPAPPRRPTGPDRTPAEGPPVARAEEPPVARAEGSGSGTAAPEVTPAVEAMVTGVSGGDPLPSDTRAKIEPHLGAELGGVRVHTGPAVAAAAASLNARAFTHGSNIFLGAGESPTDLSLMAHESTHAVQQGAVAVQRALSVADIPGSGYVIDAVRAIPGYRLLSVIAGEDPITGAEVAGGRAEFVQTLLGYGPFAGAVGPVLQSLEALDAIFDLVNGRLAENNLTLSRIGRDIEAAWDEMDLAVLDQSPNVAIAQRYINAVIADVRAFITSVVADVLALIKEAAVTFVEPLVQTPEIKPYWDLGVKVFHYDPLRGAEVSAPTVDILTDFLTLIGKQDAVAQMIENGTLAETAAWLDTQFATFNDLLGQASALFVDAWAAIQPENLGDLIDNLTTLAQRAWSLLQQVGAFAWTVASEVLALIKDSLLALLSREAHKLKGFFLLTVILGQDPFTGAEVPRTAENLIKGFIVLLPNGEQIYAQLAESGVIADAAGRIETAITELNISWELITGTFKAIWDGLSLEDLLDPFGAFTRILDQFGEPLGRIVSFVATVIGVVIELILKLMGFPTELVGNVIANARAAIDDIKADPVQFLQNLVLALKQGVSGFFDKIGTYLLAGLADWLFRGLRGMGIEPPTDLSLESVFAFVAEVLGLSADMLWNKLWAKLGEKLGPERVAQIRGAIDKLGQAWAFVQDVQERGFVAIWEPISNQLGNLWDTILNKAKDWIMTEIIEAVAVKLLSMLDPTGVMAVINSCVAFFKAVQSAVEYIGEILRIVDRYVSTIAAIARGDVSPGAAMLEGGLASAIPVAIGFLANQVGLGNVPEKIVEIIQSLRELVNQALDWLFEQAWALGQAALQALGLGGKEEPDTRTPEQMEADVIAAETDAETLLKAPDSTAASITAQLPDIKSRYKLTDITLQQQGDKYVIVCTINPQRTTPAVPLARGGPEEAALRIKLPALGFAPNDVDRMVDTLTSDPVGAEVAGYVLAGRYESAAGYRDMVSQLQRADMINGVRQAFAEAESLRGSGFSHFAFEQKPAPTVDIDLAVLDIHNHMTKVYQFVSKSGALPRGFGGALGPKAAQLAGASATEKHLVAEWPNQTMADYLARQAALDRSLADFRAAHPGLTVRVELSDGEIP